MAARAPLSTPTDTAGGLSAPASLTDWLRPAPEHAAPRHLRAAFVARVSGDDQQDPTLSIPRQFANSERALPAGITIACHFYDIETSRKELDQRGSSTTWTKYDIGIRRDGGLADLLAEAQRPDRRFDVVICESVDRIARFTHQGTKIEHDLELAGVPLLAADEPIVFDSQPGTKRRKRASEVLLRRTKQGVAEWYILNMLELSWDGFETHTGQGYNVGKPPYGYLAEKHKHPVPAKRAEGKHKTKLAVDPVRGPVVATIFAWRVDEKLSYRAIADRLNADLHRYPAPEPVDPERAVGRWSVSSVREILINPKYTGRMVWNRRSTKDKLHPGKNNPRHLWVLSTEQTHKEIVSEEIFLAAQQVSASRRRSRSDADPAAPNRHRQTKRVYGLRSYVWCTDCERRMWGRTIRDVVYYTCRIRNRVAPEGHPPSFSVMEEPLLDLTTRFFNRYLFSTDRVTVVTTTAGLVANQAADEHRHKIKATRAALADIEARRDRIARILEERDDPDGSLFARWQKRDAELETENKLKLAELHHLEHTEPDDPGDINLLDDLPHTAVNLALLPAEHLRRFLDAFSVGIHIDHQNRRATYRARVSSHAIPRIALLTQATAAHTTPPRASLPGPKHRPHTTENTGPADETGGASSLLRIFDMPRRGHSVLPGKTFFDDPLIKARGAVRGTNGRIDFASFHPCQPERRSVSWVRSCGS